MHLQQQQQRQRQSRKVSHLPSVASPRLQSDHQPQFGHDIQPSGDSLGHGGGSSRDSQASSGTRVATAEAGYSGEGDRAGVDTALPHEAMTFAHAVQEDEHNDQAQAQRGQMPQELVQQTRGTETDVSMALAQSSLSECRHRPPSAGPSQWSVQGTSMPPVPRSSCHSKRQRASLSPVHSSPAYSPRPDTIPSHPLKRGKERAPDIKKCVQ